jgi:hypothetical protein
MTLHQNARAEPLNPPNAKRRGWWLLAMWILLVEIAALIIWFGAGQPLGSVIVIDDRMTISYWQRLWPLGALTLSGLAFAFVVQTTAGASRAAAVSEFLAKSHRAITGLWIAVGLAGAMLAVWTLRAFPNSSDEYDFLFQAQTFLAGRLWNPAPPVPELFAFFNLSVVDGKWVSLYPPGWPLLLGAAMALRLPAWLACPVVGAVLLFVLAILARRRDGPLGGVLALGLAALSPFFAFNAASYFTMVPAALAGLLFCWAALSFLDRPRLWVAAAAGLALGMLGLIRPFNVIIFALPFAVEFLWRARLHHYRLAPVIVLAGLPLLAALLVYDLLATGSLLPVGELPQSQVRFGLFPVNQDGFQLTPLDELRFVLVRLIMLAEWSSPLLVIGYFIAFGYLVVKRRLNFLDFVFPSFVAVYMLVPFDGGAQYGPRYYFEGFPFLVLTIVSALVPLVQDITRSRRVAFAVSLIVAHVAICIPAGAVFGLYMRLVVDQRMDVYDQVEAAQLHNAVVVLHSGTGALRQMQPRDLTRNGIDADGDVIYVLDVRDRLPELRQVYPQRQFYIYERDALSPRGTLRPLRRPGLETD